MGFKISGFMSEEDMVIYLEQLENKLIDASKYIEYIEKDIVKFRILYQRFKDEREERKSNKT